MTLSLASPAFEHLSTPALIVDRGALEDNIARMARTAREAGVALRPHAKTHKSAQIARLQLEAGAVGIGCATLPEAQAMAAAGIGGILITSPVVGRARLSALAELSRRADIAAVVDHVGQVEELVAVLPAWDRPLRLLIDVDVGQARTGVAGVDAGVSLARAIAADPRLELAGIQGYAGHVQHIADARERRSAAHAAGEVLERLIAALRAEGLPPQIVSGSGTGAYQYDLSGPYTELQVGSYVFMDADYAMVLDEEGHAPAFTPSLFVLATVVSVNRDGQFTVDAGTKALATNGPPPAPILGAPAGATYRFGGDEHGIITVPRGERPPPLGARVLLGATHCDPTVNLHSVLHAVGHNGGVEEWVTLGRH